MVIAQTIMIELMVNLGVCVGDPFYPGTESRRCVVEVNDYISKSHH